jgi:hypothetical protein
MNLTQDNDVVHTLAPDRSDQPFGKAILPRRGWCGGLVPDAHGAQPALQVTLDLRIVAFPKPRWDDLSALLPAVIADLVRERGVDQSWVSPLDGAEHAAVARHWRGGSVLRLRRIVETILRDRDVRATRN